MARYVVLLRGINVGKHRQLPMADLKQALDGLGYTEVKTHLRSGNVVLTASDKAAQVEKDVDPGRGAGVRHGRRRDRRPHARPAREGDRGQPAAGGRGRPEEVPGQLPLGQAHRRRP